MSIRITLTPVNHSVDFEVGSPEEGIAFVTEKGAALTALLDVLDRLPKGDTALATGVVEQPGGGEPAKERKPRGPNKPRVEAVAPAPIPVPGAPVAAPHVPPSAAPSAVPTPATNGTTDPLAIPPMLQRDANNASPAIPVPAAPPPPLAAPPVPAAPPSGILANKIADNLQKRLDGSKSVDGGSGLMSWIMDPNIAGSLIIKGATVEEAIAVIRMTADDKLRHMLVPLEIAA